MYIDQCSRYFNKALEVAEDMREAMQPLANKTNLIKSADGHLLQLALTDQGELYYLVKAPVYAMATLAYMKEQFELGERAFKLETICDMLGCPITHRHQVQWVLEAVKAYL